MTKLFKLPAEMVDGFTKEMTDRFAYTLETIHTKMLCYADREGADFFYLPTKPLTEWPAIMVFEDGTVIDAILYRLGIDPVRPLKKSPQLIEHILKHLRKDDR